MRLGVSLFFVWITLIKSVGQSPSFVLNVDHDAIALDQYLEVSFTLQNGQGKVFTPPDFAGWSIINGLSTSSQVSIINGARSSSISYVYTLAPKSIGDLVIGKALVQVNGITLSTAPKKIKVTKSSPNTKLTQGLHGISKKDIFILAKATPDKAYVGQQIIVEYKLYTAVNVDNYNIAHAPDFTGFHVNNTPRGSFDNQEFINGKRYVTKTIHTASIYPIQSGSFDLEALHARASVVVDDGGDPNSFFLLPTTQGVDLVSNTIPVKILSLPQPAPDRFSGAVGKYTMAAAIDQTNVKVNDAISLTIFIEGDGDLNRVGKPFINADSSAFQFYDPKVTKESTDFRTSGFIGMRELIYPLVASAPGVHHIIPSFIYFNTDSQRYVTASPHVYNITVSGEAAISANKKNNIPDDVITNASIIEHPKLGHSHFVGSWLYYVLLVFPLMTWFGLFIRHHIKAKQELADHQTQLLVRAKSKALEELDAIHDIQASNQDSKIISEQVISILKDFLRKKWNIIEQSLSNEQWNEKIDQSLLEDSIKQKLKTILKESEFAMYAGEMNKVQMRDRVNTAREILEKVG